MFRDKSCLPSAVLSPAGTTVVAFVAAVAESVLDVQFPILVGREDVLAHVRTQPAGMRSLLGCQPHSVLSKVLAFDKMHKNRS